MARRFARILSFDRQKKPTAHIRWFQHQTETVMNGIGHPQEIYLTKWCQDIPLECISAKVKVCSKPSAIPLDCDTYLFRYVLYVHQSN